MKSTAFLLLSLQLALLSTGSEADVPSWDQFIPLDEKCGFFIGGPIRKDIAGVCWQNGKLVKSALNLNSCLGNFDGLLTPEREYVFPDGSAPFLRKRALL